MSKKDKAPAADKKEAPHAGLPIFPPARMMIKTPSVRALRDSLSLSQKQFAMLFGFSLSAVRAWEYGQRTPDLATRYYLYVIEQQPDMVIAILRGRKPGQAK